MSDSTKNILEMGPIKDSMQPPRSTEWAKAQARTLRAELAKSGRAISHSQALERVARKNGYRDWNVMAAALKEGDNLPFTFGDRVRGLYLGHPFAGTLHRVTQLEPGWARVVIDFDVPIDVVKFASFSNFRQRVQGSVGPQGRSREMTSDGVPHLQIGLT